MSVKVIFEPVWWFCSEYAHFRGNVSVLTLPNLFL